MADMAAVTLNVHAISFGLSLLGERMAEYLDGRWPFQLRIPRLQSSLLHSCRARFGRRSAGPGPPGSGPRGRGVGSGSLSLAGTTAHLPWTCTPLRCGSTPGCGALVDRCVLISRGARVKRPSLRGQARPSASFRLPPSPPQRAKACQATHVQAGWRRARRLARAVTGQRPRETLGASAPELQDRDPREQEAAERREGGQALSAAEEEPGSGGTCWLGGRSAQPNWTRDCSESGREGIPSWPSPAWEARGWGCEGWWWPNNDVRPASLVSLLACLLSVRTLIHPPAPRCDGLSITSWKHLLSAYPLLGSVGDFTFSFKLNRHTNNNFRKVLRPEN